MGKRLSDDQWAEIRRRYVEGRESAKGLARQFGISPRSIYRRSGLDNWPAPADGSPYKRLDLNATVERLECIVRRLEATLSRGAHE